MMLGSYGYRHESVKHSVAEYAKGDFHTNHDEGIVSVFKPWLDKHRGMNKGNLPLYAGPYQTLYNMRDLSGGEKFCGS